MSLRFAFRALAFCLTVLLVGFPGPVGPGRAEETSLPQSRVSLEFRDTDVLEVLKLLATKAGLNLVAGKNVTGQITLFLKDVPVQDALEVVLVAGELAVERRGNILTVMAQRDYELIYGHPYQDRRVVKTITPRFAKVGDVSRALVQLKSNVGRVIADEGTNTLVIMDAPDLVESMSRLVSAMDQPLESRLIRMNYGTVKVFAPLLQDVITKGIGRISVDERTNQIMVSDYPDKLSQISEMAQAFDERATEVLIEAKILQVSLSDKFQMGIDWEAIGRDSLTIKGLGALNLSAGGSIRLASSASKGADYRALIEAIRAYGSTTILSEPRLTVVNNQEAKILVGTKEPYVTKSVSQTGTGTAVTAESVTFIDVGIKLFVTPTITRDRTVLMKVRPEVSSKTGVLTTGEHNEVPIVETAEAETVLMIEDGGTVILGGLIKDEKSVTQDRIPVLGDIPWLGTPFRSNRDTKKKTELVVFLTPHIITGRRDEPVATAGQPAPVLDGAGYYRLLVDLIHGVATAQAPTAKGKGTAIVEFTVSPDGRLRGRPRVVSAEANEVRSLARRAVVVASPFPEFPAEFDRKPKTFKVPVTYE